MMSEADIQVVHDDGVVKLIVALGVDGSGDEEELILTMRPRTARNLGDTIFKAGSSAETAQTK